MRNQKGFTLIEIIAVLIILGILAAVAVPKFLSLTSDANTKALEGGLSAGLSTCSLEFARLAMSNGVAPTAAAVVTAATANPPGSDDFDYGFASAGSVVTVTVSWSDSSAGTVTGNWKAP
ncbi:MAG: prepilin-type N-terminal cleavage/methylation domain-containing protein [Deltaproteobacteria bacterium]|nr:prepilin-type N-terminal cleavage/methylation domain-containing protein [Deltaproteobacteria bacterium]